MEPYKAGMEECQRRNAELESEVKRLRDALEEAEALLDAAVCPFCDKSGAYYDSMGDIHQCQWCYEVKALKDRSE